MLATALHLMQGTPYIYQGEEIGMTNAYFTSMEQYRDVESKNYYHILKQEGKKDDEIYKILFEKSRDNARTPMQWNAQKNAEFSEHTPWIPVTYNYKEINAEAEIKNSQSISVKKAIKGYQRRKF